MGHLHRVYDTDTHFTIDPITRAVLPEKATKTTLIQYDHNSERFTFDLPRYIEGHDMMNCNKVEVHYINQGKDADAKTADVYLVDDLQISPDADDVVVFSWLISRNATQWHGTLSFQLRFFCLTGEVIDYAWSSAVYSTILIATGMDNAGTVVEEFSDTLEAWHRELLEAGGNAVVNVNMAKDLALGEIEVKAAEALASIPEDYTALVGEVQANAESIRAEAKDRQAADDALIERINRTEKRITNLEQGVPAEQFLIDDGVAYVKAVPPNSCDYALMSKIGGASYRSENLMPYPYNYESGKEAGGITFTTYDDQSFSIDGTSTRDVDFKFSTVSLTEGSYVLWGIPTTSQGASDKTFQVFATSNNTVFYPDNKNGKIAITLSEDASVTFHLYIYHTNGVVILDNLRVYPMLVKVDETSSETEPSYVPYFAGLRDAKVTALKLRGTNCFLIPAEIQALEGYGQGNPDNTTEHNYIDWDARQFVAVGHIVDGVWVAYGAPVVTDLSEYLTADNYIEVEGGGTVTFVNEHEYEVPSEINYQLKEATA